MSDMSWCTMGTCRKCDGLRYAEQQARCVNQQPVRVPESRPLLRHMLWVSGVAVVGHLGFACVFAYNRDALFAILALIAACFFAGVFAQTFGETRP